MKEIVLSDLINQQKVGPYQKFILVTCLLLMIMDGYDIQSMAYAAPLIIEEWGVQKSMLGVVFSASLFGLFVGSFLLSSLSDRFGRRPILLISTFIFSILMLLTPHVGNIEQLTVIRFVTGIFLAAMLGGGISALLVPWGGWQAIFYFGGIIPLIIFFITFFKLPESLYFLSENSKNNSKILFWLKKFYPALTFNAEIKIINNTEVKVKKSPLELFKNQRAFFTYSIWVISILNMISLYFLANWLPTLAKESGLSLNQALLIGSTLQLGGTIGSVVMGLKIDKTGFYKVLIPVFLVAVISVALIGYSVSHIVLLFIIIFIAGFAIVGGQPAINALSASYYPVSLRTTGVGWSIGIARLGSVIGPLFGGYLSQFLVITHLFVIAAIPSLFVIIMLMIQAKYRS